MAMRSHGPFGIAVAILALLHGIFAWQIRLLKPTLAVLDPAPTPLIRKVLAFGDDQFLYRNWFLDLQNAGDTGGRATPMRDYDYANVQSWLEALRALDPVAQAHLHLAAHYFSLTPKTEDVRKVVAFIVEDAERTPDLKWPWLVQAAAIAEVHLNDLPYAIDIAHRLTALPGLHFPAAVWMLPVVLMEKAGRGAEARREAEAVAASQGDSFTDSEKSWVNDLLQRLPP